MTRRSLPHACRFLMAMAVTVTWCFIVMAQTPEKLPPRRMADYNLPGTDAKVNLTSIEPMDIVQLIEILAHRGNLNNIVISKGVTGMTAKLKFDDVTVANAMDIVLEINQLAFEVRGGILTIMTDAEYQIAHGRSFYDQKHTRVVTLKYADPQRVVQLLTPVKSADGILVSDPVTGSIVMVDRKERLTEMEAIVAAADIVTVARVIPTETRSFKLQYGDPKALQTEVEGLLTKDVGKVRSDSRTKTLLVTDLPHVMRKVEEMLALFDSRPRQVFIEAQIVEVNLDDTFKLGINWNHLFEGINPRMTVKTAVTPSSVKDSALKLNYNTITSGGDLSVVLEALKTVGKTEILSKPQIAVLDGQEARIEVVEDQPYKEVQLEAGTTNITGTTYIFKKVGVQLAVTPRINDEDMISVLVRPEISSISAWYDGDVQEGTPVVKQAIAETTVMVKDSVTVIIGGLIKDTKTKQTTSVPVLGQIPLLGRLFRQDSVATVKSETIIFLTPRIVSGDEQYLRLQDEKKQPKLLKRPG